MFDRDVMSFLFLQDAEKIRQLCAHIAQRLNVRH
jgi:hypothetical protein